MPKPSRRHEPERIIATLEYKLPASFSREIGRVIVYWAHFEQSVRRGVWEIMAVDERMGRTAVRDPRVSKAAAYFARAIAVAREQQAKS
jgi:hypothetical protein